MKRILRFGEGSALTKPKTKRYHIYLIGLMAAVFSMCLFAVQQVSAQKAGPAATAANKIKPLQIGDTVPEETWNTPLKLYTAADNSTKTVTLADYRGKVIILDFWATWCGACLYYMPHQFKLQEQFGDDIVTLPVTYEKADYAADYIRNSSYERIQPIKPVFRTIAENKSLLAHFPMNKSLPLIVVISPEGRVDAVTLPNLLTEAYVTGAISGTERYAPLKRERIEQMPPLLKFSLPDVRQYKPALYTSITGEIDGSAAIREIRRDSASGTVRRLLANHTVLELYAAGRYADTQRDFAFAGPGKHNRRILEVSNPTIYGHYTEESTGRRTVFNTSWNRRFRHTYESVSPLHAEKKFKKRIIDDLNTFFGLEGKIEKRKVNVYVLTTNRHFDTGFPTSTGKMLIIFNRWKKSRVEPDSLIGADEDGYICYVKNMPMNLIRTQVTLMFDRILNDIANPMPIVIDETGIDPSQPVDLGFTKKMQISREELIENLRKQGFDLRLEEREIPMFVLTEPGYETGPGEKLVLTKYGYIPESNLKYLTEN